MESGTKVTGLRKIEKGLMNIEKKLAVKIVRTALRDAAKVFRQAQKANARSIVGGQTGQKIARNIIIRKAKLRAKRYVYGIDSFINPKETSFVGVTGSNKRYYIPSAIEYGHAFPGRGGGRNPPKDVPAMPYMRPAFETQKDLAEATFRRHITQELKKVKWTK